MADAAYKLFGRLNAGSLAPQILLEEVGAPYELVWVPKESAALEQLRQINATGKIPVLILADGAVVCESAAILVHLTNAHPEAAFAPRPGTTAHAHFLQWMSFLSSSVYEAALRWYYPDRFAQQPDSVQEYALRAFLTHLELIHSVLSPYVLGEQLSAADPYLHMLQSWYPGDAHALARRLPKLSRHAELLRQRPAVRKAERDHAG